MERCKCSETRVSEVSGETEACLRGKRTFEVPGTYVITYVVERKNFRSGTVCFEIQLTEKKKLRK